MSLLISLALCAAVWMLVVYWDRQSKKDKEKMRIRTNNLIAALAEVSPESIWGKAIHKVLEEPTADKLAQLIRSLKSQNRDCPDIMKSILGASYLAIINFDETKIFISSQLVYPVAALS